MDARTRRIDDSERSGVLVPSNLTRFRAEWVQPAAAVRDVVDTYWAVNWQLAPADAVEQRIVDFPAVTLSIEEGDVPAPFVGTTVRPGAWSRVIRGRGAVFAIRLRPAGLAVVSDLDVRAMDHEQEITPEVDDRAHRLLSAVSRARSVPDRASRADDLILGMLRERSLSAAQRLANVALDALTASPRVRRGRSIAAEIGTSERTLQRALRCTIGLGPNDVARRIRLQEVVRQLSLPDADAAATAAALGYADQAHLINEFRAVADTTPGRYVRDLQRSMRALHG